MRTPDEPNDPFVCLHDRPGGGEWFAEQILELDACAIEPADILDPDDETSVKSLLDKAIREMAARTTIDGAPAHLIATGEAVAVALRLAVDRPDLVRSLLLGDPSSGYDDGGNDDVLRAVSVPTLVIASAPEAEGLVSASAQRIAGLVDNGVLVLIDGCRVPAHRENGVSFDEWAMSFAAIAEGLATLNPTAKPTTEPITTYEEETIV